MVWKRWTKHKHIKHKETHHEPLLGSRIPANARPACPSWPADKALGRQAWKLVGDNRFFYEGEHSSFVVCAIVSFFWCLPFALYLLLCFGYATERERKHVLPVPPLVNENEPSFLLADVAFYALLFLALSLPFLVFTCFAITGTLGMG